MRILFLCHRIPYPPNKGEKIRTFHQLRALTSRHEVDLFCPVDDPADLAHRSALEPYCRQVTVVPIRPLAARILALPYLLTRQPLTLPYFHTRRLRRAVEDALAQRSYERIFISCSAMAQYVEGVTGIPVVLDLVDVDSDKWAQYAGVAGFPSSAIYRREARRLRAYEERICAAADCVVVTTDREASLVREFGARAPVHVIPNGVDTEFFSPHGERAAEPVISFTGDMGYYPNSAAVEFFARKVFPSVRQAVPNARFLIVGRNPTLAVRNLGLEEGITVTGAVPDVRPYLRQARVAVAPFAMAAGIPNKVLEALACGLPVVATPRAVQGLAAPVAAVIATADSPEGLSREVVRLLADPDLAEERGREGRRAVSDTYNWQQLLDRLLRLVDNPAESTAGTGALAHT